MNITFYSSGLHINSCMLKGTSLFAEKLQTLSQMWQQNLKTLSLFKMAQKTTSNVGTGESVHLSLFFMFGGNGVFLHALKS